MSIHGDPRRILDENKDAIAAVNLRMGYRFLPEEITWPDRVVVGEKAKPFKVAWAWKNLGVAPPYRHYYPCLTVKDDQGRIVAVLADGGLDLMKLEVAEPGKAVAVSHEAEFTVGRWSAPHTRPGKYDVFVSVGEADGTPVVELPLPDGDGRRRYRVGTVTFANTSRLSDLVRRR